MLKLISNLIPHIVISLISAFIQLYYTKISINFIYLILFHFWYYACFSHIPIFKVKRSFIIKLVHTALFVPFWVVSQKYCDSLIYHTSYLFIYTTFLYMQYGKYKKTNPEILCISQHFLREWPYIIGYRVIGELIFEESEIKEIQRSIMQANPNAILWSAKLGSGFRKIMDFCLRKGICLNILEDDVIKLPSIAHCLEKHSTLKIAKKKFIICGENIVLLQEMFDHLSELGNEVFILLNSKESLIKKMKYKKLFKRNVVYNVESLLKQEKYYIIDTSGITSFNSKDKDVNFLYSVEKLSKLCKIHNSTYLLLSTQIYENKTFATHEMIKAAENITNKYSGKALRLPYIATDFKYDLYSSKFKQKFLTNHNISDGGSWISIQSATNHILENLDKEPDFNIHGSFLTRKEIYSSLNMVQRSWNIWPKKLDYIRGQKSCIHPISRNL